MYCDSVQWWCSLTTKLSLFFDIALESISVIENFEVIIIYIKNLDRIDSGLNGDVARRFSVIQRLVWQNMPRIRNSPGTEKKNPGPMVADLCFCVISWRNNEGEKTQNLASLFRLCHFAFVISCSLFCLRYFDVVISPSSFRYFGAKRRKIAPDSFSLRYFATI